MTAIPLTKRDSITAEINAIAKKFGVIDDFSMTRIGNQIESLSITNYAASCFCWMMLYGAKGDKENFLNYQKLSEQHGFTNVEDFLNYAVGFANVGLVFDALNYAKNAHNCLQTLDSLIFLRSLTYDAGRFIESLDYFAEIKKMKATNGIEIKKTEEIVVFMKENNLSDDDVSSIVMIAEDILQKNDIKIQLSSCYPFREYDEECLVIDYAVNSTPKKAAYLNVELADKMARTITNANIISKVSCSFIGAVH